jgi:hypothetical protein
MYADHDGKMVDEPCTRKSFLVNCKYNGGDPCIPVDGYSFYMDLNNVYVCRQREDEENTKKEEDQRSKKTRRCEQRWRWRNQFKGPMKERKGEYDK